MCAMQSTLTSVLSRVNTVYVVYSIGDNWSFDDHIAAKYGCTVRAFDPRLACYSAACPSS